MDYVAAPGRPGHKVLILLGGPHSGLPILCEVVSRMSRSVLVGSAEAALANTASMDPKPVTALNERIFQDLRIRWDMPLLLMGVSDSLVESRPHIEALLRDRYLDGAVSVLRDLADSGTPIVLSDFRVSLFPSLWHEACVWAGLSPSCGFIHRNPLSVANALRVESNLAMPRSQQIWLRYNLAALEFLTLADDYFTLSYEDLIFGEESALWPLARELSLPPAALVEQIQAIVKPGQRQQDASLIELDRTITISSLAKEVYLLMQEWGHMSPSHRMVGLTELKGREDDYSRFAGNIVSVRYDKAKEVLEKSDAKKKRLVILHYHLFKNAGTSVDAILKKNFGKLWEDIEFLPPSQEDHARAILKFIAEHDDLLAISSHTLFCPPPVIADTDVLPIIFVRQPLKRLRSAYDFERKQVADTAGAKLAKETDFAGYLRTRLSTSGDRSCRNFQAYRLARLLPDDGRPELERAFAALDQLPFVGLVEEFSKSMRKLKALVQPRIPSFQDFEAWENSTSSKKHDDGRARPLSLQEELGEETYAMALEANRNDIAVYEEVVRRYA
jgi:hypothetical protein